MKINIQKLTHELNDANIKISGCNSNGIVWAEDGITEIQTRADVKKVIKAHDPTETPQPDPLAVLQAKVADIEAKLEVKE